MHQAYHAVFVGLLSLVIAACAGKPATAPPIAPAAALVSASLFGVKADGKRIVYIINRDGSLFENYDQLRAAVVKSIGALQPEQSFNAIMYCDADVAAIPIFPELRPATPENKKQFIDKFAKFRTAGHSDAFDQPLREAMEQAFAMKPDTIYWVTNRVVPAGFHETSLTNFLHNLDATQTVQLNAFAFCDKDPVYRTQLEDIAKAHRGTYRFVSEADLER